VPGDRVVDVGSGGGFDSIVAAHLTGGHGRVVGVDMTPEMLAKSQETARLMGLDQVEFRQGLAEDLPIEDGWADVAISNGVLDLVADKARAFSARSSGWCGRTGDSSSPTSPSAERSRRRRSVTSTCRPTASRAACPVTAGGTHFETPGSSTSRSDHPWTPSAAPRARPTPEPSRSSVTPSSPQARPVTPRCRCVAGCQTAGAAEGGERATCACSPGEHPVAREDQRRDHASRPPEVEVHSRRRRVVVSPGVVHSRLEVTLRDPPSLWLPLR
jgi:hypothetical protein